MRVAIYFTPSPEDALTRCASTWLGRDAFTGRATRQADPAIDTLVAEPARYGFHATMKAPFRLASRADIEHLDQALELFCASRESFVLETLQLARIEAFFALTPYKPSQELPELEQDVVETFDGFRAPLSEEERSRRQPDLLTDRQRHNLDVWGYPHVREDFRFHMTLTGPLPDDANASAVEARLAAHLANTTERPLSIDGLALFVEPQPGLPFVVHARHPFGPAALS
jgi:putative phosphonate metabolism protein